MEELDDRILCVIRSIWADASLLDVKTGISDYIVELKNTGLKFALKIKDKQQYSEETLNLYRDRLAKAVYRQGAPNIPAVIALYDIQQNLLQMGVVLSWRFGTPIIEKDINFIPFSEGNADKILDLIKMADQTIRLLENTNCKVLKRIIFRHKVGQLAMNGDVEYLRDFGSGYRMKSKQEKTEKEELERLLKGIPEDDYPRDIIDDKILEAVRKAYPEVEMRSSLLLFNTEMRDLKFHVDNSHHFNARVDMMPTCDMTVAQLFSGVDKVSIGVDLYMDMLIGGSQPQHLFYTSLDTQSLADYEAFRYKSTFVRKVQSLFL